MWLDTVVLSLRCRFWRRLKPISHARVLVVDCGVHTEGWQIAAVDQWFRNEVRSLSILAFEANP